VSVASRDGRHRLIMLHRHGHLVLKHYPAASASSLLSSWLQPAAARKRTALLGILDDWPESTFLLV